MKYILITVCEREIYTQEFNTLADAQKQMLSELMDEVIDSHWDDDVYNAVSQYKFDSPMNMFDDFYISSDMAWSSLDDDWNLDWKIVAIY